MLSVYHQKSVFKHRRLNIPAVTSIPPTRHTEQTVFKHLHKRLKDILRHPITITLKNLNFTKVGKQVRWNRDLGGTGMGGTGKGEISLEGKV